MNIQLILCLVVLLKILTILVGDLVNKGPFSAQVIRYVRERGWKCVMGNHDYAIAQAFGREGSVERKYGTNSEKNNWISQMSPEDKQWLCDLPYTIRIPDKGVIIVHAGFVPGISLQVQRQEDMILLRNIDLNSGPCSAEASVAKGVGEGSRKDCSGAWADEWSRQASILGRTSRLNNSFKCQYSNMKKEQELKVPVGPDHTRDMESADALLMNFHVVFGHDAKRGLQLTDHATGLDTGCCYGKKLTGLIWPERTLVQVPARRVYEVPGQRSAASASDTSEYASTNTSPVAPKALFSKSLAAKIASHNHAG